MSCLKNVRQIGDPEDRRKIYIEDYVITYLRRLAGEETLNSRVAILLGHSEQDGRASLSVYPGRRGPERPGVHGEQAFPLLTRPGQRCTEP